MRFIFLAIWTFFSAFVSANPGKYKIQDFVDLFNSIQSVEGSHGKIILLHEQAYWLTVDRLSNLGEYRREVAAEIRVMDDYIGMLHSDQRKIEGRKSSNLVAFLCCSTEEKMKNKLLSRTSDVYNSVQEKAKKLRKKRQKFLDKEVEDNVKLLRIHLEKNPNGDYINFNAPGVTFFEAMHRPLQNKLVRFFSGRHLCVEMLKTLVLLFWTKMSQDHGKMKVPTEFAERIPLAMIYAELFNSIPKLDDGEANLYGLSDQEIREAMANFLKRVWNFEKVQIIPESRVSLAPNGELAFGGAELEFEAFVRQFVVGPH